MSYLIVPDWVLDARISAGCVRCYIFLLNNSKGGKCQLHYSEIASGLGVSKRQAQRYIYKLIDANLVDRYRPKVFGSPAHIFTLSGANMYEMRPNSYYQAQNS